MSLRKTGCSEVDKSCTRVKTGTYIHFRSRFLLLYSRKKNVRVNKLLYQKYTDSVRERR